MTEEPIIVSFSGVMKWDTCERQFYYGFVLGLRPEEDSVTISTGGKGHKLLQVFYEALRSGMSKEEARQAVQAKAKKLLSQKQKGILALEGDGGLLKAWGVVDNYIKNNDFTNEAVLIENRFLIPATELTQDPFFENVQIGFTPDVVFRRPGGFHDVEDSKFVQRMWAKKKLERFPQAKLYEIFLKKMGYKVSRSSIRFFNTATGEIKPQNYIMEPGEDAVLLGDFLEAVRDIVYYVRNPTRPLRRTMNYTACNYCYFELPCSLEAKGKDATKTLKHLYVKSDYDYSK